MVPEMPDLLRTKGANESANKPLLITVAPNGARLTHQDHLKVPMSPAEMEQCALSCQQAGAAMLHMHARDKHGLHTLDPAINQQYLDRVQATLGSELIIQLSTECIGRFSPEQQMHLLRSCRPEAASIALRELIPDQDSEPAARELFAELAEYQTICQLIIYSRDDLLQYYRLLDRGTFCAAVHHLLFVVGRQQAASEVEMIELLAGLQQPVPWSLCAFGPLEHRLTAAAIALNGDIRVGFENNLMTADGQQATDNAALVAQAATVAKMVGRPLLSASQFRQQMLRV